MRHRLLPSLLASAALLLPVLNGACAPSPYRVYDSYHADYHTWNGGEVAYYQKWEVETHRDHRDFKERQASEQKEYFDWRHSH